MSVLVLTLRPTLSDDAAGCGRTTLTVAELGVALAADPAPLHSSCYARLFLLTVLLTLMSRCRTVDMAVNE